MDWLRTWLDRLRRLPRSISYLLAVLLVTLAALVRWLLGPLLGNDSPYLTFLAAVALCSLLLERGSGFFATIVSGFLAALLFVDPPFFLNLHRDDTIALFVFLALGLLMSSAIEVMRLLLDTLSDRERHKDALLRELHHRTRNNLQIITAIMAMDSVRSQDDKVKRVLASLSERIASLGRLQQQIYRPGVSDQIDSQDFLEGLCDSFVASLMGQRPVAITWTAPRFALDRQCAANLAIVINELLTNSLKYAFPGGAPGTITVTMDHHGEGGLSISVADDGLGCSLSAAEGTGLTLVRAILRPYRGTLMREDARPGCRTVITIPKQ